MKAEIRMPNVNIDQENRLQKFHEGYAIHQTGKSKKKLWIVLRGSSLYIFKSSKTLKENMVGCLTLNVNTQVISGSKKAGKSAILLSLETTDDGISRMNTFKFESENKRDVWKSYIMAVTQGIVPSNTHLLPGQLRDIHQVIEVLNKPPPLPNVSIPRARIKRSVEEFEPVTNVNYPFSNETTIRKDQRYDSDRSGRDIARSESDSLSSSEISSVGSSNNNNNNSNNINNNNNNLNNNNFHLAKPVFYRDMSRNHEVPGWFFSDLIRNDAESILTTHRRDGNILMRKSINFKYNGKYVISMLREISGGTNINHYEVLHTPRGYVINVDESPGPLPCLSDIMDFFVSYIGKFARPMTNNHTELSVTTLKKPISDTPEHSPSFYISENEPPPRIQSHVSIPPRPVSTHTPTPTPPPYNTTPKSAFTPGEQYQNFAREEPDGDDDHLVYRNLRELKGGTLPPRTGVPRPPPTMLPSSPSSVPAAPCLPPADFNTLQISPQTPVQPASTPVFNTTRPQSRVINSQPSFEDELKGRLGKQKEQVYASGATILKSANW